MLDQEDKEDLQYLLIKLFPEQDVFKNYEPTERTLELYIKALKANIFCNMAVTYLATELAAAGVNFAYRGKMKGVVKKILKKIKKHYQENNFAFVMCDTIIKFQYLTAFSITLNGYIDTKRD